MEKGNCARCTAKGCGNRVEPYRLRTNGGTTNAGTVKSCPFAPEVSK